MLQQRIRVMIICSLSCFISVFYPTSSMNKCVTVKITTTTMKSLPVLNLHFSIAIPNAIWFLVIERPVVSVIAWQKGTNLGP